VGAITTLLSDSAKAAALGAAARRTIEQNYSLEVCVPRQLALMQLVAANAINP